MSKRPSSRAQFAQAETSVDEPTDRKKDCVTRVQVGQGRAYVTTYRPPVWSTISCTTALAVGSYSATEEFLATYTAVRP